MIAGYTIAPRFKTWEEYADKEKVRIQDAIYIRVSDDKKKSDGERRQDLMRQQEVLANFLVSKGITTFKVYADDAKSAWTDDINAREDFVKLLNDCRRNFIKRIFIEDMTRFSRNLSLGLQWIKELGELGVQIISLREGEIDATSSQGWMKSAITLMFAEWDSRIKSEKVKSGMEKAMSKVCPFCKVRHQGRHPNTCKCDKCLGVGKNFQEIQKGIDTKMETGGG